MEQKQLNEILDKHKLWLEDKPGGEKADLSGADLRDLYLSNADLRRASLINANLRYVDLSSADLIGSDLTYADLRAAILAYAILSDANLTGVDLRDAYLIDADLNGANLSDANLSDANLKDANLSSTKIDYQIQEGLLLEIKEKILADHKALDMESWHSKCGTTHCLAGWACQLNPVAKELEKTYGTQIAGLLTLGHEAHSYFYKDNKTVLNWIKGVN